jgi:hypothetical protein
MCKQGDYFTNFGGMKYVSGGKKLHETLTCFFCLLLQELLELRSLEKFADERNCIRLYHQMWCAWKQYVSSEKSAKLLKYLETDQKASLHARRYNLQMRKPSHCPT